MAGVPKIAQLVKYFTNSDGSKRRRKRRSRRGEEENINIRSKQTGMESCCHESFWLSVWFGKMKPDGKREEETEKVHSETTAGGFRHKQHYPTYTHTHSAPRGT